MRRDINTGLHSLIAAGLWAGVAPALAHPGLEGPVQLAQLQGDAVLERFEPRGGYSNEVTIKIEGDFRVVRANGIPDHASGRFPNRNNPNSIYPQEYTFRVPVKPAVANHLTDLGMHPFGVAVNGVVFDPKAAEWWRGDQRWQYDPLAGVINLGVDTNNAHVQPTGAYHYHSVPTALLNRLTGGKPKVVQLGWAADGFPIYSHWGFANANDSKSPVKKLKSGYRLRKGERQSGPGGRYDGTFLADYEWVKGAGDLDECNGRTGVTPEFPKGTYYYVITEEFPNIPMKYRGEPDRSFFRGPGGPGGFGPPGGRRPPPPGFGPGFPPPPPPNSRGL